MFLMLCALELRWASLRRISDLNRYRTLSSVQLFLGNIICFYNKEAMFYFFVSNDHDEQMLPSTS